MQVFGIGIDICIDIYIRIMYMQYLIQYLLFNFDPSASATLWTHQEQLYGASVQTGHPLKTKTGKILGILGRYVDEFFSVVWEADLSMPYYQGFSGRSEIRSI